MKSLQFWLALTLVVVSIEGGYANAATIGPITILTPSGGESYVIGSSQTVRLDPKTKAKSVKIELSRDGGTTYAPLGTINNLAKTGRDVLSFTVTGPASSNCLIRATGDGGNSGVSSGFSIGGNTMGAPSVPPTDISSGAANSGLVLTSDGSGGASFLPQNFVDLVNDQTGINGNKTFTGTITANKFIGSVNGTATNVTGVVAIANGGTGSTQKNFVDLTTNQTNIAGDKTFIGKLIESNVFVVEPRPNNTPAGLANVFIGSNAGASNTTGQASVFIGTNCGAANTTGNFNSFYGSGAGKANTTASDNSFFGSNSGFSNTSGFSNSFFGSAAGSQSSTGANNAFFGAFAGQSNTASNNAYFGSGAGRSNTTGTQNSYFGVNAGNQTNGSFNSFFGAGAGQITTTGANDAYFGNVSGVSNTTGSSNAFFGGDSGQFNTTGSNNVFVGASSGSSNTVENQNTFIGDSTNGVAGITNSTAIGANASVTASNCVVLGSVNGVNGATASTSVGIGVTAPNSTLQVNGSLSLPMRTVSAGTLILFQASDYVIVNTSAGATYLLPTATGLNGRIYVVKNLSGGAITLKPVAGGETIDGGASVSVANGATAYAITDGTNWFKIN